MKYKKSYFVGENWAREMWISMWRREKEEAWEKVDDKGKIGKEWNHGFILRFWVSDCTYKRDEGEVL